MGSIEFVVTMLSLISLAVKVLVLGLYFPTKVISLAGINLFFKKLRLKMVTFMILPSHIHLKVRRFKFFLKNITLGFSMTWALTIP